MKHTVYEADLHSLCALQFLRPSRPVGFRVRWTWAAMWCCCVVRTRASRRPPTPGRSWSRCPNCPTMPCKVLNPCPWESRFAPHSRVNAQLLTPAVVWPLPFPVHRVCLWGDLTLSPNTLQNTATESIKIKMHSIYSTLSHCNLFIDLKEASSAHQDCIYLIKNTVKNVKLWNIFTI